MHRHSLIVYLFGSTSCTPSSLEALNMLDYCFNCTQLTTSCSVTIPNSATTQVFCNTYTVTNPWLQSTPPLWGDACHSIQPSIVAPLGRCGACVLLCCNVLCLACLQHWWFMHTCTTFSMQWASLSCNQQWGDEATRMCLACMSQALITAALCRRGCLLLFCFEGLCFFGSRSALHHWRKIGDGDLQVHTSPSSDKAGYPYHLSNDCEHDRLHGSSIILVLWRAVA